MILAVETATPVCSVAIETGARRIFEKRIEGKGVHSEYTFTYIRELLERANIDVTELEAVLFSKGPGSYTGLRIGAAAIQGLLFKRDVPFYSFPTLLSFAAGILRNQKKGTIHSVIDARREHLYRQKIEIESSGKFSTTTAEIEEISAIEKDIRPGDHLVGTGWERLNINDPGKVSFSGSEAISAKNLIEAWRREFMKNYFKKEKIEQFEPDYLTMAQVNNSPISG
ncbi:MAG: tRNA (adenosine(37)-N6)-threonylcarbamoyltransferase complex dimerization subunit type 1 TsaB [Balneolaceae bacterium]